MIDIVNVTKRFGKFTALSGMNLSVGCSSILAWWVTMAREKRRY